MAIAVACLASGGRGQGAPYPDVPFSLSWVEGKCVGCKIATEIGKIQFVSRTEAWAVGFTYGPPGSEGSGDFVAVHTTDSGHTWREVSRTYQHAGDPDGPPAISFIDAARGWIGGWNPAGEPKLIRTGDGGRHWEQVSDQPFQRVLFFNENHGCATEVTTFFCTSDGGRHWTESHIPHIRFLDRMLFLTPEIGWLASTDGKDFLVFRTADGGRGWQESRTSPPEGIAQIRDLFFLDQNRGWLITWHLNDYGTYLFSTTDGGRTWLPEGDLSFQGRGNWMAVVRFVSAKSGFLFESQRFEREILLSTADGGAHWGGQPLPRMVSDCQVYEGDLLCSGGNETSGFNILTVHLK